MLPKQTILGLNILEVPEAEYAVVKLKGIVPNCIHEGWKYVTVKYFSRNKVTDMLRHLILKFMGKGYV